MANATTGQTGGVSRAHADSPSKTDPLAGVLAAARDTARDQLAAAWQIETDLVQEQLSRGWRGHLERVFEERFEELTTRVQEEFLARIEKDRAKVRRDVSHRLDQAVRRFRIFENEDDWSRSFVDATEGFCERAALFTVNGPSLRMQAARGLPPQARIDNTPLQSAPAFTSAVESRDTIVALRTAGELSSPIAELLGEASDERAYLFPISRRDRVAAVLYADSDVDSSALELLASFASAVLESQSAVPERSGLVALATTHHPGASISAWASLSKEEQELHLKAQRFARVQVAEMRLYKPQAVKDGRVRRDLYGALRQDVDRAQEEFRRDFLSASPTMVDYLHLELLRTLANNEVELLGNEYPGPMV